MWQQCSIAPAVQPRRMVIATGFVLGLTGAASVIGPCLSGLLTPLPIFATVFAVFTHQFQGAAAARQVPHGVVVSSFACAVFFLVGWYRNKASKQLLHSAWNCCVSRKLLSRITHVISPRCLMCS